VDPEIPTTPLGVLTPEYFNSAGLKSQIKIDKIFIHKINLMAIQE